MIKKSSREASTVGVGQKRKENLKTSSTKPTKTQVLFVIQEKPELSLSLLFKKRRDLIRPQKLHDWRGKIECSSLSPS